MKKTYAAIFTLLLLSSGLFAENARVLPAKAVQLYAIPAFSFATGINDGEGNYIKPADGPAVFFNMGLGLDYGIINWITASLQWIPGWTLWSDVNSAPDNMSNLFIGAKVQLVGEQAPLKSEAVRLTIGPGIHIPLMDDHAFAVGARFYFDLIFNRNFFVNIYNETLFYTETQDLSKAGPEFYGTSGEADYSLSFALEPVFTTPVGGSGIDFTAGLSYFYRYLSAPQHSLGIGPNVSLLFTKLPMPLEFKFQYDIQLWGRHSAAINKAALQVRAYYAFGR